MEIMIIYALVTLPFLIGFVYVLIKKWKEINTKKANKILPKSGCFRQAPDCRHPREYLCIKCGDCGRKFIK